MIYETFITFYRKNVCLKIHSFSYIFYLYTINIDPKNNYSAEQNINY